MAGPQLMGLLVSPEPQARMVMLGDGSTHELHFKQLPAAHFRRYFTVLQSGDEARQSHAVAGLIADSLCNPDGTPALTVEEAALLTAPAERAITDALMDVNGLGKKKAAVGNGLPPEAKSGSGTS